MNPSSSRRLLTLGVLILSLTGVGCMQEISRREVKPHHFDSSVPISASTLKQEPEPTTGEETSKAVGNFMKQSWRQVSTLFGLLK